MTIYDLKAIELRYQGQTYRQISKALGGKISEGVLRKLFMVDGRLYLPYLEYEAKMNNSNEEEARSRYKKMLGWSWKMQQDLLKKAIKAGDFRLAFDIIKDMNDRGGLVVIRKSEVNVTEQDARPISRTQFFEELTRMGIDPRTGLRVDSDAVKAD